MSSEVLQRPVVEDEVEVSHRVHVAVEVDVAVAEGIFLGRGIGARVRYARRLFYGADCVVEAERVWTQAK